jgi:hypothetical protein
MFNKKAQPIEREGLLLKVLLICYGAAVVSRAIRLELT